MAIVRTKYIFLFVKCHQGASCAFLFFRLFLFLNKCLVRLFLFLNKCLVVLVLAFATFAIIWTAFVLLMWQSCVYEGFISVNSLFKLKYAPVFIWNIIILLVLETLLQTKENENKKMIKPTNMVVEHLRYSNDCLIRQNESLNKQLEDERFNRELEF